MLAAVPASVSAFLPAHERRGRKRRPAGPRCRDARSADTCQLAPRAERPAGCACGQSLYRILAAVTLTLKMAMATSCGRRSKRIGLGLASEGTPSPNRRLVVAFLRAFRKISVQCPQQARTVCFPVHESRVTLVAVLFACITESLGRRPVWKVGLSSRTSRRLRRQRKSMRSGAPRC
jgi:hypothetical protein